MTLATLTTPDPSAIALAILSFALAIALILVWIFRHRAGMKYAALHPGSWRVDTAVGLLDRSVAQARRLAQTMRDCRIAELRPGMYDDVNGRYFMDTANRLHDYVNDAKKWREHQKAQQSPPIGFDDYQEQSARTMRKDLDHKDSVLNMALGLAGEAGEAVDLLKKHYFHDHELDREKLQKELGDALYGIGQLARLFDWRLSEVAQGNIDKLKERYPNGFEADRSINRA